MAKATNGSKLPEAVKIDFTVAKASFDETSLKVAALEAAIEEGIVFSDAQRNNISSFNVTLKDENGEPFLYNGKKVSALTTINAGDTLSSLMNSKYVLVESTTKKGKPIAFYLRDSSKGECTAIAWVD